MINIQTQDEREIVCILKSNHIDGTNLISTIDKINKIYGKNGMISSACSLENIDYKIKEFKNDYSCLNGNVICLPTYHQRWIVLYTYLTKKEIFAFFNLKAFL